MATTATCQCRSGPEEDPGSGMPVCSRIDGVNVCVRCGYPAECQSPYALEPTLGLGFERTGWHAIDPGGHCLYCGQQVVPEEPESPGGIVWPPLDDDDDHHRPGVRTRWRSAVLKAPTWC